MAETTYLMRRAQRCDQQGIKDLVFTVFREYGYDPAGSPTNSELDDLEQAYFSRGGWFEVVCSPPERIVGCWGLSPLSGQVVELRKMYLTRSYRGCGIGKLMLEAALSKARELGFRRIELETAHILHEAIGLYTRFGFQRLAGRRTSPQCDQAFWLNLDEVL